jgi:hypothetical protein
MRAAQLSCGDIDGNASVMGLPPKYSIEPNGVRSLDVQRHGCPAIAPMAAAVRDMDALA